MYTRANPTIRSKAPSKSCLTIPTHDSNGRAFAFACRNARLVESGKEQQAAAAAAARGKASSPIEAEGRLLVAAGAR